jgi:sugar (pentulose or hexulose) kinase
MPEAVVLTLDVGLTNCKASLFVTDGALLAQQSRRYPTATPEPDRSEQDPADWWATLAEATRDLLAMPESAGREILAVSVTAHMHGLVALAPDLRPLTTCWTLFDRRAEAAAAEVQRRLPLGEAYRRTGGRLEGYTPAAKIAWLRTHEPELFAAARLFVAPKDALRIMLGGEPVTDPIDAAGALLWNLETRQWDESLLAAVGARAEQLPEVREPWADAGGLSAEAAAAFGLPVGLPLVVGAGDDIEVIGAGVVTPGQALEHIGTTGTILVCTDCPAYDPAGLVEVYPHPLPGRYLAGGATNAAGRSLDWAARLLAGADHGGRLRLEYPPADGPEPPLYLPYIKGERGLLWSAGATGACCGLREEHGPADLALAVYEGVALSLKEIIAAATVLGATPQGIVSGTPLDDRPWAQLRADCYGLPLQGLASPDLTGLGAAMLALVNQGVYGSLEEAVAGCCRSSETISPDPARAAGYERRLARYLAVARALRPTFDC